MTSPDDGLADGTDGWVALDGTATPEEVYQRLNVEHAARLASGYYEREASERAAAARAADMRYAAKLVGPRGRAGKPNSERVERILAEYRAELEQAAVTEALANVRTLFDIDDAAPGPLLLGMLEPAAPTLLYAAPGVGKGTTGAHLVVEAQMQGLRALVFDAERHGSEWSRRVAGLGGDRSKVDYLTPDDLGPLVAGQPFWDMAQIIRPIVKARGVDLFVLDSLVPASGVGEERLRSDAAAPFLFVKALDSFDVPSVAFGHPPKGQPEGEPFGSMAWVAAFRLTWLGTKAEGEGHSVRWRPRKRNERGHIPGVLMSFEYDERGRLSSCARQSDDENSRDQILGLLVRGPMTVAEMADDIYDRVEDAGFGELDRIKERLSRTLRRMRTQGWVDRIGKAAGRGVQWQLRERA